MSSRSVLVVEDEEEMRNLIREMLQNQQIFRQIVLAVDGSDALHKIGNQEFDLIITDLKMPKADGVKLINTYLDRFHKKDKNSKEIPVPIIVVSGFLEVQTVKEMATHGLKNFLTKPFKSEDLVKMVKQVLNISQ